MSRFRFLKSERVKGKKHVSRLICSPEFSFHIPPLFIRGLLIRGNFPHKVLILVPKRRVRLAVRRNLIKRRLREAYRNNKFLLDEPGRVGKAVWLSITYSAGMPPSCGAVEEGVRRSLRRVSRQLNQGWSDGDTGESLRKGAGGSH